MFLHRPTLRIVLAGLLALRAFVPIGYMLQLPAHGEPFGLSVILCPTQNPALDLSLLGVAAELHAHHHAHVHHDAANSAGESAADLPSFDAGCGLWLNGATVALDWTASDPLALSATARYRAAPTEISIGTSPGSHNLTRAPPSLG